MSKSNPLYSVLGEEGMEARVYANVDGVRFNVVLVDTDCDMVLPTVTFFEDLNAAIAYADSVYMSAARAPEKV